MKNIKSRFIEISFKLFRRLINKQSGKLSYQELFEELHAISLKGMNIGEGSGTSSSGEIEALNYIKTKCPENNLILFDVGANIGLYTKLLKEQFNENAKIYSFEPSNQTFKTLQSNVSATNVSLSNFGFGEIETNLTLYSNQEGSGLASVYNRRLDHFGIDLNLKEEIKLRTIDAFCEENEISTIDFLKIDVEGHEINVLKGAKKLIDQRKIRFIQFEFGGCNIDARTYFQDFYYLLKDNYRIFRIVKDGVFPIKNYKEMYEAFITTNYLAELIEKD